MKQKFVYVIDESFNGWFSVEQCEVNQKDKYGFYYGEWRMSMGGGQDDDDEHVIKEQYLFKDENIGWWRTEEAAQQALNIKLRELYLKSKLGHNKHSHYRQDEEADAADASGICESDLF